VADTIRQLARKHVLARNVKGLDAIVALSFSRAA